MTQQDEIIEMARQAKLLPIEIGPVVETSRMRNKIAMLEAFAKLVAAKEQEAIIDLVAFYGGPVDLEAAIRARGEAV